MKKIVIIFKKIFRIQMLILIAFLGVLTSCSENQENDPVIYNAVCAKSQKEIDVRLFKDVGQEREDFKLQSCAIDKENGLLYKMNSTDEVIVYDLWTKEFIKKISKKVDTGHDNDACIIGDKMYLVGSKPTSYLTEIQKLYCWNLLENKIEKLKVEGIEPAEGQAVRCLMGVSEYSDEHLLLVTQDYIVDDSHGVNHQETDKLCVYDYDIALGTCEKKFETKWDAVFIQGATYIEGYVFVACNIQTEKHASNYKGIEIKVISLEQQAIVETIHINGHFEAEGLEHYTIEDELFLMFGISNPGRLSQIVTMKLEIK
ncbi:MAG: hypothetical protein K2N42_00575 [Anaeroplasmataceae bacterium]|nr:hypothetical protein [Anaeroplasmataceae bacterium]